jgi:hypothetical protein
MRQLLRFINDTPKAWVRLLGVSFPKRKVLLLHLSVDAGRGGRSLGVWTVETTGLLEHHISDSNGGGLRLSDHRHPAARQYTDSVDSVRFEGSAANVDALLGELWTVHQQVVDDWIDPDRYLPSSVILRRRLSRRRGLVCRGPRFLVRHYAGVLRRAGLRAVQASSARGANKGYPKVLHFGHSFVVARRFLAERDGDTLAAKHLRPSAAGARKSRRGET